MPRSRLNLPPIGRRRFPFRMRGESASVDEALILVMVKTGLRESIVFKEQAMRRLASGPSGRIALVLAAALLVAGCANRNNLPDNAAGLGLGGPGGMGGAGGLGGAGGSAAPGSSQDFTVNVGDRIFFDTDSSSIRADAQTTLANQARWLNQYPAYAIVVEGHADERGTREYNIALGARRAAATRDFLAQQGVAANRMRTISFGKERPVAVCDDISCWSQNRRAVTVLSGAGS